MSDDFTEQVLHEVILRCRQRGVTSMTIQQAAFLTKTQVVGPNTSRTSQIELTQTDYPLIIAVAVERACGLSNLQWDTIKMQVSTLQSRDEQHQHTIRVKQSLKSKSEKLVEEIIKKKDESQVFNDIVAFILHETKLSESQNAQVDKETRTALESVIPRSFIKSFIAQPQKDKRNQLYDLWKIVWGIRVFNKAVDKGGAGIEPFNEKAAHDIQRLIRDLEIEIRELEVTLNSYTLVVKANISQDKAKQRRISSELINRRQFHSFLIQLRKQADDIDTHINSLNQFYHGRIEEIKRTVESSASVPKSVIYPMFIMLAENWQNFQDAMLSIKEIKNRYSTLKPFKHTFNESFSMEDIQEAREALKIEEVEGKLINAERSSEQPNERALEVSEVPIRVELNGYDIVPLVTDQTPMPGDPKHGFVKFNDRFYSFSNIDNKNVFRIEPDKFTADIFEAVHQSPDLLLLIGLDAHLPQGFLLSNTTRQKVEKTTMGIQTETHPIDSHLDYNYEFSEWKLRKRALKIADLRTKQTHSAQTDMSHFRRENETQVYLPKEKSTNTVVDKGTQPIKQLRYVQNLRGDPKTKMNIFKMQFEP